MSGFDPFDLLPTCDPLPPPGAVEKRKRYGVTVINGRGRTEPDNGRPVVDRGDEFDRPVSAATWTISHGLRRLPGVTVYDEHGALMLAEVYATETQVVVVHANPCSGSVVLT